MPCDSITTIEVDAGKLNLDLAQKALESMGLCPWRSGNTLRHARGEYNAETGQAIWNYTDQTTDLKKAYAAEIVKAQAKRYGWTLKQDPRNAYHYTAVKR